VQEREIEEKKKKPLQDSSLPHLVSFFLAPSTPALLVSRGVTAQAPFSSNNNNNNTSNNNTNKRNSKTQSQKKSVAFNIKQQRVVFLELSCKKGKNM
jgi:hypothetical protein